MRPFPIALAFLFLLTSQVLAASSTTPMRVVFPYIPLMAESSTQGVFVDMYTEIAARSGLEITIEILPVRRAVQGFKGGVYDALGAFPSLAQIPVSLASVPFYRRENLIFYRSEAFGPSGVDKLEDLDGRRVGLSAYHYPDFIVDRKELGLERVPDDEFLLRMIASDRLDAAIIEHFSGLYLLESLALEDTISIADNPVTTENVLTLFKADRAGIENRKAFNKAIYEMLCDGTLAKLFGRVSLLPDQAIIERELPPSAIIKDCNPRSAFLRD
ncbi:amino acid ABC transporter substrate-binding protein [Thalassospira sp. HF15]|uniref:substrate-binding periplasmic protein n=1 Tax=Thalassospira sp. HF15 TaxID=2722755 RepID=UPI00142FE14E|nr:transporter substrate-binding domain-containing protein [Thalassospira sp. HF15]NIY76895.1 amino acid ABC transporter substrate-binding protein [Thalassospira sp. HF15]